MKKNKKQPKIKARTLKKTITSKAIEKDLKKRLLALSKRINTSVNRFLNSNTFNAFNAPVSNILSVGLDEILKRYIVSTAAQGVLISKKFVNAIKKNVDLQFIGQGLAFSGIEKSQILDNSLKANYLRILDLIKTIPAQIIGDYKQELLSEVISLNRQKISQTAQKISGISKRRADLIARDQTHKASVDYAAARAMSLGFEYYEWDTSHDERVSKGKGGHIKLQGRIYKYGDDTAIVDSYGTKGHCGTRINCRCVALPVFLEQNQKVKKIKDADAGDYYIIEPKV